MLYTRNGDLAPAESDIAPLARLGYNSRPRARRRFVTSSEGIPMIKMTAGDVASLLRGDLQGNPQLQLTDVAALLEAGATHLTYVTSDKQVRSLPATQAGAVLLSRSSLAQVPKDVTATLIGIDDAQAGFVEIMLRFRPPALRPKLGISPLATVSPTANIGEDCNIHPGAVIGDGVVLGRNCDIHPGAVIGAGCRLGDNVVIHPNAVLYHDVHVGSRVVIHATAVIGADGFGYRFTEGRFVHLPHTGTVILEDDVEIGAGTTVDRAMIGATMIGAGTKLDNQVMIAHNCRLGKHNAFAAQVGLAGSATTGDYVRCGGQVGVADHAHIGTGCSIGAMAGVSGVIPDGERYHGIPARPEKEAVKAHLAINSLPEMRIQLRKLDATVKELCAELDALRAPSGSEQKAA
jgi:UDP-3-O-[3-hydroxymyristoyl] glucosamine N-acyltransferase